MELITFCFLFASAYRAEAQFGTLGGGGGGLGGLGGLGSLGGGGLPAPGPAGPAAPRIPGSGQSGFGVPATAQGLPGGQSAPAKPGAGAAPAPGIPGSGPSGLGVPPSVQGLPGGQAAPAKPGAGPALPGIPGTGQSGFGLPPSVQGLPGGLLSLPIDICAAFTLSPSVLLGADLVKGTCSMAQNWLKGIQSVGTQVPQYRSILTPAQREYWDSVVKCNDVSCICKYWPRCRNFTVDITHGTGGAGANITDLIQYVDRYGAKVRKDIRAMTDVERRRFFYALNKLKYDKIDGWSKYDILTGYHFFIPFIPEAHFSAGFLPFHRELLKNLEVALRFEHPLAFFPYWDSSLDSEMPNPKDTVLWTEELLGSGDGNVTDGPFSVWEGGANHNFPAPLYQGGIFRAFGQSQKGVIFNKEHIDVIMKLPTIQDLVFCKNPFLDTVHAGVHLYVGGMMADPSTSPGDPVFYLHHCFIDSLWEQWRQKHQTREQRQSDVALPCPYNPFDLPDMQMFPFNVKVRDGYSNIYTDEVYTYQEPAACSNNCHNSTFLVCKPTNGRCMSKIRVGGDCSGLDSISNVCYKGKCQGGKCVAT